MDPIGTTMGVVSLATAISGVFVSVVQCIEYVQLGRAFGKDFNKCQVRLNALELRLTRWGVSAGVLTDPQTDQSRVVKISQADASQAARLLGVILEDIQEVERKSKRYHDARAPALGSDALDALVKKTNNIVSRRLKDVGWTKKTKWALYEKRHFDGLLADITGNLSLLEDLFPQVADVQKVLCVVEVEEIQNDNDATSNLRLLGEATETDADTLLAQTVRDAIARRGATHKYERTEAYDEATLDQGDLVAAGFHGQVPLNRLGHNYGPTILKGRAKGRQGDTYGDANSNRPTAP